MFDKSSRAAHACARTHARPELSSCTSSPLAAAPVGASALVVAAHSGHGAFAAMLLEKGADPNARVKDNTLTRTIFTMQWFYENGATAFIRAAQSSDTALMSLLLKHGADPKAVTAQGDNALTAAAGIGWVDGVTYERSPKENVEAVRMLLDLGLDPNSANQEGRTPLMGAALKGRTEVIELLVARGAKLDMRDRGSRDTHIPGATIAGLTWQALDYAEGLVRVGVQSAVERPEAVALIRKLPADRGQLRRMVARYHENIAEHTGGDRWYLDASRCGGGCLIDLGTHLVDLALRLTEQPDVRVATTDTVAASWSKSSQRRPSSSLRRMPLNAASHSAVKGRCPAAARRNC